MPESILPWRRRGGSTTDPGRRPLRHLLGAALLALLPACMAAGSTPSSTAPAPTPTTSSSTTTLPRVCEPRAEHPGALPSGDAVGAAVAISSATFPCADRVVLAADHAAWAGASLAASGDSPLLLVDRAVRGDVAAELRRLAPEQLTLVGLPELDASIFEGYEVQRVEASGRRPEAAAAAGPDPARLWIVSPDAGAEVAAAWVAAEVAGDAFVRVDAPDLRSLEGEARRVVEEASQADPAWVGELGEDAAWTLEVVRAGGELPGGGQLLLPGRRLVAFYGNPTTPALGVLGEQGPLETIQRMQPIVDAYGADGVPVVPAFEIIATVASAGAGEDGDYSEEMTVDQLRPWVEAAGEHGVYVILDLQPGRTSFLEQARRYEELLLEPHVGLALDPEWRLGPDQLHLRQIGSVPAEEVNQVAEWLAGMVRSHHLPQKLLLLHQFRFSMIADRETLVTPPELAVVIQMDGQGPLGTKYDTWNALTAGTEQAGWWWGWKNFYDEDSPMATPEQVLALEPVPVYVSFQ